MSGTPRYTFEATFPSGKIDPHSVKVLRHTENELETTFPYSESQSLNCTEFKQVMETLAGFYAWGAEFFGDLATNLTTTPLDGILEDVRNKMGTGKLVMYHKRMTFGIPGLSNLYELHTETYNYEYLWPHSINFGELCYSTSDEIEMNITWRFKKVTRIDDNKELVTT